MATVIGSFQIESAYVNGRTWTESVACIENSVAALSSALSLAAGGSLVGQEVRWKCADTYARYLITKEEPLELMHLGVHDASEWDRESIKRLTIDDVRAHLKVQPTAKEVFSPGRELSYDDASQMAKECLLIRSDQWRELAEIDHVDLQEMYESTTEERMVMSRRYKSAYRVLGGR